MTIQDTHTRTLAATEAYAQATGDYDATEAPEAWQLLADSSATFTLGCSQWSCTHGSERVQVMAAGSDYSGDILDASNSHALDALTEGWQAWQETAENEAALAAMADPGHYSYAEALAWLDASNGLSSAVIDSHGSGYVQVCVAPDALAPDVLAAIIETAEGYAEYPILDESDYSERTYAAELESFADATHTLGLNETEAEPLRQAATEAAADWLGYSEPGYISEEHTARAWLAAAEAALAATEPTKSEEWQAHRARQAAARFVLPYAYARVTQADATEARRLSDTATYSVQRHTEELAKAQADPDAAPATGYHSAESIQARLADWQASAPDAAARAARAESAARHAADTLSAIQAAESILYNARQAAARDTEARLAEAEAARLAADPEADAHALIAAQARAERATLDALSHWRRYADALSQATEEHTAHA